MYHFFTSLVAYEHLNLVVLIVSLYLLNASIPSDNYRILWEQDKIIFQKSLRSYLVTTLLFFGVAIQILLSFAPTVAQIEHVLLEYWYVWVIWAALTLPLSWLMARSAGVRVLEIDVKQRTYSYIHQPPFKFPIKRRQGSLEDFAGVDVWSGSSRGDGLTRVNLKFKRANQTGLEYHIGLYKNPLEALEMAQYTATKLGLPLTARAASLAAKSARLANTNSAQIISKPVRK